MQTFKAPSLTNLSQNESNAIYGGKLNLTEILGPIGGVLGLIIALRLRNSLKKKTYAQACASHHQLAVNSSGEAEFWHHVADKSLHAFAEKNNLKGILYQAFNAQDHAVLSTSQKEALKQYEHYVNGRHSLPSLVISINAYALVGLLGGSYVGCSIGYGLEHVEKKLKLVQSY